MKSLDDVSVTKYVAHFMQILPNRATRNTEHYKVKNLIVNHTLEDPTFWEEHQDLRDTIEDNPQLLVPIGSGPQRYS